METVEKTLLDARKSAIKTQLGMNLVEVQSAPSYEALPDTVRRAVIAGHRAAKNLVSEAVGKDDLASVHFQVSQRGPDGGWCVMLDVIVENPTYPSR